jgi:hypothetical protein
MIVFVLGALREWWREEREGLLRLLSSGGLMMIRYVIPRAS